MNPKFTCEYCDSNYNSLENLNRHLDCDQTCDKYKNVYFICYDCKEYVAKGHVYIKRHKKSSCKKKDKNYIQEFKDFFKNQEDNDSYELLLDIKQSFIKEKESLNKQIENLIKQNESLIRQNEMLLIKQKESNYIFKDDEDDDKIKKTYRKPNSKHIDILPQKNREMEIEEISKMYDEKRQTCKSLSEARPILKQLYEELPNISFEASKRNIEEMKKIRMEIFKVIPYDKFKQVLDDHIVQLTTYYKNNKNYQDKRVNNYLIKSLSSIETRILMFPTYHSVYLQPDEINLLESCLEFSGNFEKEYVIFSNDDFFKKFHNFGSVVLSIKKLIKVYLFNAYGFNNYIYLPHKKNTEEDPYTFYKLVSIDKGKLHWEIDCRAENLTNDFISDVLPFLTHLFRRMYCDIFHDNTYRKNYKITNSVTENECEQLIRNIFVLSDQRTCCDLFRQMIKENACKHAEENDKFSMFSDDSIQREKFLSYKHNNDSVLNIISTLFDEITLEDAVDFLREKFTYN